jgi:hypothetical protein
VIESRAMRGVRQILGLAALVTVAALAFAGCGGGDDTTSTTTQTDVVTESTQTATVQSTATTPTATTQTTTTPKPVGPASCGPNQVFSQTTKSCVNERQGGNPCPPGEVPMADRPVCVPKQE